MQVTIPWGKIKSLEEEIKALKALGKPEPKKHFVKPKKNPLEGFLKGVNIPDEEIEMALKEAEIKFDYDHIIYQKHKK